MLFEGITRVDCRFVLLLGNLIGEMFTVGEAAAPIRGPAALTGTARDGVDPREPWMRSLEKLLRLNCFR